LKTIGPDHADNAVAQDMLLREARLTIALKHEHIVTTHVALRLPDGRPALVLEWMPGSLSDRMNAGPFSPRDIRHAMTAILSGLEAVHVAGLVHADISPDNLLLAGNELTYMKIADFGIALETGQRHADLGLAVAGHTEFSAPEQAEGKILDGRSDLYSCGRIIMLLLARCSSLGNAADPLRVLAHHLTRHDPDDRPESASAALRLLNAIEL
jgi:type VI secretion system protein ImpN